MSETISVSKNALFKLFEAALYPDPVGEPIPGRYHHGIGTNGQERMAGLLPDHWRNIAAVFLNPQPLPPQPDERIQSPLPVRAGMLARLAIDQVVAQYRMGEYATGSQGDRAPEAARTMLRRFLAAWCGNEPHVVVKPPHWPDPWPGPLDVNLRPLEGIELLAAAAQFHKAAAFNTPLKEEFASAVDQLIEAGFGRSKGLG